jgi:hypothetical protein
MGATVGTVGTGVNASSWIRRRGGENRRAHTAVSCYYGAPEERP